MENGGKGGRKVGEEEGLGVLKERGKGSSPKALFPRKGLAVVSPH